MSTKVLSNQRVTVLAGLASGIGNWDAPSLSNLAALTNVSAAVNWPSFELNLQASQQVDDRTLTDAAGSQSRGFTNFGGTMQFVHPAPADSSSVYRAAYNIFSTPRVELVVAVRYGKLNSLAPAAGDKWTIYRVIVDAPSIGQNDSSKFYQVTLVARDKVLPNYIVPPSSPVAITLTVLSNTGDASDHTLIFVKAAYQGHDITKVATWVVSDETKLVQVHPGIFRSLGAGSPTVKAQYPGATDSSASTITISA